MKKTFEIITYCAAVAVLVVSLGLLTTLAIESKKINDYQQKKMVEQRDTIGLAKTQIIQNILNKTK